MLISDWSSDVCSSDIGSETKYIADGDYFYPYDKISTFDTGKDHEYLTDRQSTEACNFIERNKEKPFFLYLRYYSVHTRLYSRSDTRRVGKEVVRQCSFCWERYN